jgi:hypothetical protein
VEASGVTVSSAASQVSCLDVRVVGIRLAAERAHHLLLPPSVQLYGFVFGNRCDAPVRVDFTQVRATARLANGARVPLKAFDPRSELRPAMLGPRRSGSETIEFDSPNDDPIASVCVDMTQLADGAGGQREVCFGPSGEVVMPGPG